MTFTSKTLIGTVSALALLGFVHQANAYTITLGGSAATDGSDLTTSVAGVTVDTFNPGTVTYTNPAAPGNFTEGTATYTGQGGIENGSVADDYAMPANDTTNYLVAGTSPSFIGTETLTLTGGAADYLGLYWGSMDAYNSLTLYDGTTLIGTITGDDVSTDADGNQTLIGTNDYVNIFGLPAFTSVVFSTSQANFEVDNVAYGSATVPGTVPEPGTLLLFGAGVIGLGGLLRRYRKNSGGLAAV